MSNNVHWKVLLKEMNQLQNSNSTSVSHWAASHHTINDYFPITHLHVMVLFLTCSKVMSTLVSKMLHLSQAMK